jgi:hypothetical protein
MGQSWLVVDSERSEKLRSVGERVHFDPWVTDHGGTRRIAGEFGIESNPRQLRHGGAQTVRAFAPFTRPSREIAREIVTASGPGAMPETVRFAGLL